MSLRHHQSPPSRQTPSEHQPYNIIPSTTSLPTTPPSASPKSEPPQPPSAPSETSVFPPSPNGNPTWTSSTGSAHSSASKPITSAISGNILSSIWPTPRCASPLSPPPDNIDSLDPAVLRRFRRKLLRNYSNWCSFLGRKPNIWISDSSRSNSDHRRELLYVSLYLLIWGESANLRFVPECICFIFHHLAMELNKILEDYIDENTGQPILPSVSGENAFLNKIVKPIYETIKAEVDNSKNGTAPHSAWRNYDDINEYFWSRRCFDKLKWPIDVGSNFFGTSTKGGKRVGKTGFVEQRSF